MTFSDALPVQFWLVSEDTFNEKEVDGVFNKCFCAPWKCSDSITLQFSDTTGYNRTLFVRTSDNGVLYSSSFSEVSTGLYQLSFTPGSNGVCDEEVQFVIASASTGSEKITDSGFDSGSGWSNVGSIGQNWTVLSSHTEATVSQGGVNSWFSRFFTSTFTDTTGSSRIRIAGTILRSSGFPVGYVKFYFVKNSTIIDSLTQQIDFSLPDANGVLSKSYSLDFITDESIDEVRIYCQIDNNISGSYAAIISVTSFSVIEFPSNFYLAKSDCLSIKTSQPETVLINYHNNRVFDSLNSSVGTPDPDFNLRIPATFFDERFPKEVEQMDLSNSRSIQLNAQLKAQKLLKIKHMPYYMHKKAMLALMFQNVTIDSKEWIQGDTYEILPGNPRYPLKQATCWLTQKTFIVRNVL